MADLLLATVRYKTTLPGGYRQHASHQSMTVYLDDWEAAHAYLGRRIEVMRAMRDERLAEVERGDWPPPMPVPSVGEERVVTLMRAFIAGSLAAAITTAPTVADGQVEIPNGEGGTLRVWTTDGQTWTCAAYDHGPFCRLCQRATATTLILAGLVANGEMTVIAAADGELRFKLTPLGEAHTAILLATDPEAQAFYDGFVVNEMEKGLDDD